MKQQSRLPRVNPSAAKLQKQLEEEKEKKGDRKVRGIKVRERSEEGETGRRKNERDSVLAANSL